jgi:hypothetical protein
MRDNFDLIKPLLDFSDAKTFYFIQILKRRKDNPDLKTDVQVIDNIYIYEPGDLERMRERIIDRCNKNNARAYINLNRLDVEKIALHTLKKIAELVVQGDYRVVKNAYASVCGSYHSESQKRWVVDIDSDFLHLKGEILLVIENLHRDIKGAKYKILAEIPTRSGVHIISNPFNMQSFREIMAERANPSEDGYMKVEVQKNSPTILYTF